jgi:hypothetical protein
VLLSEEAGHENCERITRDDLIVIGPLTPIQNRQYRSAQGERTSLRV